MFQDYELKLSDIVRVNPVFRCLPDEVLLHPSCSTVAFDRVAPRPYQIIQPRQFDDESIIIIFEERFRF